ncbi:MAG: VTC domain-containing protein [Sphingobacteriaceae bacterium]|nr:VTC domain-containing protein [Sphingobacteriaceae bacterium]
MKSVADILNSFESITLAEMDKAKLMDRTDTKFTFSEENLKKVLTEVKSDYKILEIENCRMSTYQTLYYDTSDLSLYLKHHNGKLNRYKIRHRTYVESKLGFLEVKFKNNKGRTIKVRIKNRKFLKLGLKTHQSFYQPKRLLILKLWCQTFGLTINELHW